MFGNNSTFKFKKLQTIATALQYKIFFLSVKSTLNNVYVTVTDNFGKIFALKSGGSLRLACSKKNTSYVLELLLLSVLKRLNKFCMGYIILNIDFRTLKKKKAIFKILQKFHIKVLAVQFKTFKAFNGVKPKKQRRV